MANTTLTSTKRVRESTIEAYLRRRVRALGGEVRKVKWIGRRNAPDDLVILNGAHFIELKRPGERPTPAQWREIKRMRRNGASVEWANSKNGVDAFLIGIGAY